MEENNIRVASKIKEQFLNYKNKIDIIIPYYNEQGSLVQLVESIIKFTRNIEYTVYLVNDGCNSTDIKFFFDKYNKHIKILDMPKNSGFGAAVNHGLRNSFEKLKVVLHSDCLVENAVWLSNLYSSYVELSKQGCALVTSKTNNSGTKFNILENLNIDNIDDVILDVSYVPFYSAMFSIDLIGKIGFIKPYPYMGYENEEFCARLLKAGYKIGLSGKSFIKHHGGKTVSKICSKNPDIKNIIKLNRDLCKNDIRLLFAKK
jgi:GT2 family glycosyltransferase